MAHHKPTENEPEIRRSAVDRRTALRFDLKRDVDDSTLRVVLDAATRAPSPYNLQPWRFVLIRAARNRRRLRDCAYGQTWLAEAPAVVLVLGYLHPETVRLDRVIEEQRSGGLLDEQAAGAARSRALRSFAQRDDAGRALWATRSAMLAAASLMHAAQELGLAPIPSEEFDMVRLRTTFGIPDDHLPCLMIGLGYAAERSPAAGRLALDEVCDLEHFGAPWPQAGGPLDSAGPPH
ncbi:nitroreductase family protein [Isosphaeraceae bacterium EP7]